MEKEPWRIEKEKLVQRYREENKSVMKGKTVFVGSSLMEMFPVQHWAGDTVVYNRGIGGYKTADILPILDVCVFDLMPKKVFINIGTNDLSDASISLDSVMENYDCILSRIEENVPGVRIYLMAYYPINYETADESMKPCLRIRTNEKIALANERVRELAARHGQRYIDVNGPLKDDKGDLRAEYTIEGMHIKPEGYRAIFPAVMAYVTE